MSKAAILDELLTLTADERQEIRLRMAELDHDDWLDDGALTEADKKLIDQRVKDFELTPDASISWAVAEARLTSQYGK